MEGFFQFCGLLTISELYCTIWHSCLLSFMMNIYIIIFHEFVSWMLWFAHFCLRKIAMFLFNAIYTFALLSFFHAFMIFCLIHCQKSRILFMYLSKYVCHFQSLEAAFYLAIALIKEKIWCFYKIHNYQDKEQFIF